MKPLLSGPVLALGLICAACVPAAASPPLVLAQFFEHFDEFEGGGEAPAEEPSDPALKGLDPEGLDLDGLNGEGAPGAQAAPNLPPQDQTGDGIGLGQVPADLNPAERSALLADLYDKLAQTDEAAMAEPITAAIEELWASSGSDTVDLLMNRATRFANAAELDLSLSILDAIVDIAPKEAEAWYLRAKVNVLAGKPESALIDLRRALRLDAKHYRAITDLGLLLETLGAKKEALEAYRRALAVNPFMDDAKAGADALKREVEGQDI